MTNLSELGTVVAAAAATFQKGITGPPSFVFNVYAEAHQAAQGEAAKKARGGHPSDTVHDTTLSLPEKIIYDRLCGFYNNMHDKKKSEAEKTKNYNLLIEGLQELKDRPTDVQKAVAARLIYHGAHLVDLHLIADVLRNAPGAKGIQFIIAPNCEEHVTIPHTLDDMLRTGMNAQIMGNSDYDIPKWDEDRIQSLHTAAGDKKAEPNRAFRPSLGL